MADLTITATSVVPASGATTSVGTAGEALTAGQAVYLKAADGRLWKAQCDSTDAEATVVGITLNGAAAGQPVSYQSAGTLNIGGTTAKTTYYVLSATAGGIAPQADLVSTNRIVHIGYSTATTGTFVVRIVFTGAVV
jgi:predicted transcriptional regulator